jgi:hypothetical protein
MPRPGQVLGLVGTNGIGKSTALRILAGKLKPNLGKFDTPPDWQEILTHFRGSELQNYFTRILEDNLKAIIKPQYVDNIPKAVKGNVKTILGSKCEKEEDFSRYLKDLDLEHVQDRDVSPPINTFILFFFFYFFFFYYYLFFFICRLLIFQVVNYNVLRLVWLLYKRLTFICLMNLHLTWMYVNV